MRTFWVKIVGLFAVAATYLLSAPAVSAQQCVGDADGNNEVSIGELVKAVRNALDGCGFSADLVSVSGTVASADAGDFRIWATGHSGTFHKTETHPDSRRFTLLLPPNEWYVVGFGHYPNHGEMHFAGHMVSPCGDGETDHFFLGGRKRAIDLGAVALKDDGSFARPQYNPLYQLDHDGDGTPDVDDADFHCEDIGDHDHNGFYDDDMDHDGHHDDDIDHDGHHDDTHHGGHH